jgi:hypothetical protein
MWLRDSLPYDLSGVRILVYGYDTRLESSQSFQSLRTLAGQFKNQIRAIRGQLAVSPTSLQETLTNHEPGRPAAKTFDIHCP